MSEQVWVGRGSKRVAAVTAIAVILSIGAAAFGLSSATAAAPEKQKSDTELHVMLPEFICGFPIALDGEGQRTIRTHSDKSGEVRRTVVKQHSFGSFSNLATGSSIDFVVAWTKTTTEDDGVGTTVTTGHVGSMQVPGQGSLSANVGRLVETGDVIVFEAGRHESQFTEAFCSALS